MPLPQELEVLNDTIDLILPILASYQSDYLNTNGCYEQLFELSGINGMPELEQGVFQCHEYSGPQGNGYMLAIQKQVESDLWLRTIDQGPEGRSRDWFMCEEE